MKQTITFNSYLSKIVLIAVLFTTLPMLFSIGGEPSTTWSYIRSCLCFFALTLISVWLLLGKKYVRFYAIAFIVQIMIGLLHYLIFLDPDYFSTTGAPFSGLWREYQSVFGSVEGLIEGRKMNGAFYFDSEAWYVTHPEIWRILTWPITFLGLKWLTFAPLNVFSSLLASTNLMVWYNCKYANQVNNNESGKYLLFFSAFFPQFLLNDTVWRDPFGIALISVGLVLLSLSDSTVSKICSFIVLAIFSFFQRTVYLVVSGATLALRELNSKSAAIKVILAPLFVILIFVLFQIFGNLESEGYSSGYVNEMSFLALPIKIIFGLIGPFPWTQFPRIILIDPAFNYQIQDYFTGTFQVGYLFAIVSNWKNISFKKLDYMTIMGFGIALSGFVSKMMHIGYISEGLFFTLPWFFSQIGPKYRKYLVGAFIALCGLNLITIVLGTSGITNFYR